MRAAQRSYLCVVAAALLLLTVANARLIDGSDLRNGIDHAPLKVDRIVIDAPRDGRHILADIQSTTSAPKQESPAAAKQDLPTASSSLQTTQAQPAAIATAAVSNPAAAAAATATAADPAAAVATTPAAKATATAAAAAPGVAATASKPTVIPTKPLFKAKKGRAAVAAASIAGAKPANAQKSDGLRVTPPEEQVEQMNWEQLMAEDAPPTACRWEPKTAGVRWNVGCANKALGSSCNGMVLAEPPFCEGRGGSIATIKCLPDGEWGEVDALC